MGGVQMRAHPHPLPPDERDAIEVALREFLRVNQNHSYLEHLQDISVPRDVYERIERAFSHFPTWIRFDRRGRKLKKWKPVVLNTLFVKTGEPREHLIFKGVCCFYE